ncbi:flavodoxin domain-containing protein [Alteromonas sp. 5E99-2]|uniref:flavodoxin domain-containing protein n=1 Tax=Alteromonas sp. 5E99-2 TaxID=2817683 RepID=UPI001A981C75|nr:flavodoxin domain-containing protein [Alteromonas sp. 5E99-2]MBO1254112.1 flavodoxin domain-containing protein [Alteromonas sp. 5E99-2]
MPSISIFYGSVYGNAQNVAQSAQSFLESKDIKASLIEEPSVQDFNDADVILVVSSTTGQGDLPPNLEWVIDDIKGQTPSFEGKRFAIVAMGDSSYGDSFCGAGKTVFNLLESLKAQALVPLLEVDDLETLDPEADVATWLETLIPLL